MKVGIKMIAALDAVNRNANKRGRKVPSTGILHDGERAIPKSFLAGLEQQHLIYVERGNAFSSDDDPFELTGYGELVLQAFKLGKRYA